MKDNENLKWSIQDIAHQYKIENLNLQWKECWIKARMVYKELNRLNANMANNNKIYYKMNTPFSFYGMDNGLSSIPELDEI